MAGRGPQNGRRGLEMGLTQVIGHFEPLSLNKFLDPSTPSMRKGRDGGGGEKKKKKIKAEIVATNVVAGRPPNGDRLQRRPLVPMEKKNGK